MFNEVGVAAVAERIKRLTDRLVDGLELKGYAIHSPRPADAWSGIVAFTSPRHTPIWPQRLLKEHRIEIAPRTGGCGRRRTSTTPRNRSTG